MKIRIVAISVLLILAFSTVCALAQESQAITIKGVGAVISCSSFCDEYDDIKFYPSNVFKGRSDKPWMAGEEFDATAPEWLKVTFTKPVGLMALRISPGFGSSMTRFYDYPRIRKMRVTITHGKKGEKSQVREYLRRFDGAPYKDMVLLFSDQPTVNSIKFEILDVYKGKLKNMPLIGAIDPVLIVGGKVLSSSSSLEDLLSFLRATSVPASAFSFLPGNRPLLIRKILHGANPIYPAGIIRKNSSCNREYLKKNWSIWLDLCNSIYTDYKFNTFEAMNYFWIDNRTGKTHFDMFGSESADVMNSYQITLSRQNVTEKVNRKDKDGKKKETEVTVLKTVVDSIKLVSDIYTP